jgi:26S proteasome regulatory subunit N1
VLHAALDMKNIVLGKSHFLLYMLAPAMHPRMLITVDRVRPVAVGQRRGAVWW